MKDMKRLLQLRDDIIKPVLKPVGFKVVTPDEGEIGNVMRQVLLNLEQADLLIADITGHNPNVMYELGVYHSFGKPYIIIKDTSDTSNQLTTPFDIAEYRFHEIDFNDRRNAQLILKRLIKNVLSQIDQRDWFSSPVTDFYQSPIAEIPTAIGLSKNYKKNFFDTVFPFVFQKDKKGKDYLVDVCVETNQRSENGKYSFRELSNTERKELTFEVLLPASMNIANHQFIEGLKNEGKVFLKSAEIGQGSRPFKVYFKINEKGHTVLVDIPTVLSTLYDSIMQRRQLSPIQFTASDWILLEQQELTRFAMKCDLFKKEKDSLHPECRDKIFITKNWNPYT